MKNLADHNRIIQAGMDPFIDVKTIRLKGSHPAKDIYLTLDGKLVAESDLDKVIRKIKKDYR